MRGLLFAWFMGLSLTVSVATKSCRFELPDLRVRLQPNGTTPDVILKISCQSDATNISYDQLIGCSFPSVKIIRFQFCPFNGVRLQTILEKVGVVVANVNMVVLSVPSNLRTLTSQFLVGLDNLRSFLVYHGNISSIEGASFQATPRLKSIVLSGNHFHTIPSNAFSGLSELDLLQLGTNNIAMLPDGIFDDLISLRRLFLFRNKISDLPTGVFTSLGNLTDLSLLSNQITSMEEETFSENVLLKTLDISKNKLQSIPSGLFMNLTSLDNLDLSQNELDFLENDVLGFGAKINTLDLSYNNLSHLSENVLNTLTNLESLDLSHNVLESLPEVLIQQNAKLRTITLSSNGLEHLPAQFFNNSVQLTEINLSNNSLWVIPNELFSRCISLTSLELQTNNLTSISRQSLPSGHVSRLTTINLSKNKLTSESLIPYGSFALSDQVQLVTIDLSYNLLSWYPSNIFTLLQLRNFNLRHNSIGTFDIHDLAGLGDNVTVDLTANKIATIVVQRHSVMPRRALLRLSKNPFTCDCRLHFFLNQTRNDKTLFPHVRFADMEAMQCHSPVQLANQTLSAVALDELKCVVPPPDGKCGPDGECECVFRPHTRTLSVNCSATSLTSVPEIKLLPTFKHAYDLSLNSMTSFNFTNTSHSNLVWLDLRNNQLTAARLAQLHLLPKSLQFLDLSNNSFQDLPVNFLKALDQTDALVDLRWNPWVCNCQLKFLHDYIQTEFKKVTHIRDIFCQGYDVPLIDMKEEDVCLSPLRLTLFTAVPLVAVTLGVLLTVAILHYKTSILVWLYKHQLCLWFVSEDEIDVDKQFDAFISFAHEDEDFVNKHLLPGLEDGEPRYRVCIHYRDWTPGELIETQIISSVKDSRRTLVVLSQSFIDSVWTAVEFRLAHQQALQDKTNRVIVIVYGEMPPTSKMDDELVHYIRMHTYLDWKNPKFWDQLRYAMPHQKQFAKKNKSKQDSIKMEHLNGHVIHR